MHSSKNNKTKLPYSHPTSQIKPVLEAPSASALIIYPLPPSWAGVGGVGGGDTCLNSDIIIAKLLLLIVVLLPQHGFDSEITVFSSAWFWTLYKGTTLHVFFGDLFLSLNIVFKIHPGVVGYPFTATHCLTVQTHSIHLSILLLLGIWVVLLVFTLQL